MDKIIYWGTGKYGDILWDAIDSNKADVIAVVDSNPQKYGEMWHGICIDNFISAIQCDFDCIFVAVKRYDEIIEKIKNVDESILVYTYENYQKADWINYEELINVNNKIKLCDKIAKLERNLLFLKAELDNYDYEHHKNPYIVKSDKDLLDKLIVHHCSLGRFGDGEFELLNENERPWFQEKNSELAKKLKEVISSDDEYFLVAISDFFGSLENYTKNTQYDIRVYLVKEREKITKYISPDKEYYDAYVTRCYLQRSNKNLAKDIFDLWKKVWDNKKIAIVEGPYVRNGINNDLFDNASSISRIICPYKNAFERYDEIISFIKRNIDKEVIILISLGPTATVMAYDLFKCGYQAIDLGQLDNEYEWFLMKTAERVEIRGKGVPELRKFRVAENCENEKYIEQIIMDFSG